MSASRAVLVLALAAPLLASIGRALADDGDAPAAPPDLIEQWDRKKMMSIKVPRTWKPVPSEEADEKALVSLTGFFGEPQKSPNGFVVLYTAYPYARATLARALEMPQVGPLKEGAARQGPGWAEACAVDEKHHAVVWRRYVEKNGRCFLFLVYAAAEAYDAVHAQVEKMLDSATIPGEGTGSPMAAGLTSKKNGEFDVQTDAGADRAKSVDKQVAMLADARDILAKALPGKPFDATRPTAWIFQNATKYEDKAKAAMGVAPKVANFDSVDRAAMVELMSETQDDHDGYVYYAGGRQYVWQYFGGETPPWIAIGLGAYAQETCVGGGKGKLPQKELAAVKSAVAAGKRRLNEWIDVGPNEITDMEQGQRELYAWHLYFRKGGGSKKFKAQYDAYLKSLRDTGDPTVARKAFDGANFDEMLQDMKNWVAEWK